MRVVSLLPSATELICLIGGTDQLVGRSHECDEPRSLAHLPVLTGPRTTATTSAAIDEQVRDAMADSANTNRSLYTLDEALLRELAPDLIVTQDLCDVCSIDLGTVQQIAESMSPAPRILSLNPQTLEDVFEDVIRLGEALSMTAAAEAAVVELRGRYWTGIDYVTAYTDGPQVAFLEWMDPLFVAGHWTPQLITAAGGRHDLNAAGERSRQITADELIAAAPDRLIICPCGFDLAAIERELPALVEQAWWKQLPAVRDKQVVIVDGNQMFNRPGPRLVDAFRWLVSWINDRPEVCPEAFPARPLPEGLGC